MESDPQSPYPVLSASVPPPRRQRVVGYILGVLLVAAVALTAVAIVLNMLGEH